MRGNFTVKVVPFPLYPKTLSAPAFQVMIVPSRVLSTIASSEDSTIAASTARTSAGAVRSGPRETRRARRGATSPSTRVRFRSSGCFAGTMRSHVPHTRECSNTVSPSDRRHHLFGEGLDLVDEVGREGHEDEVRDPDLPVPRDRVEALLL